MTPEQHRILLEARQTTLDLARKGYYAANESYKALTRLLELIESEQTKRSSSCLEISNDKASSVR